ncbi:homoserine dehydrogenase [Methanomassiliicoccaceae archaeon COG_1]|nr:homoserine dehydrogenase [Methanomassiliicoccaceae archaeon COG_1]
MGARPVVSMMVNAELYVRDLPGQLVGSLEPISMVDGNIVGVVHDREQKVNQRILVSVTFEVSSNRELDRLKAIWKSRDVIISKMGSVYKTCTMEYMILGTFNAGYVDELLDEAAQRVDFESVDVTYSSSNGGNGRRTAMISAELKSQSDLDKLDELLATACEKDGLIYIRGL